CLFLVESPFFFSSRRRHTRFSRDWSSDVCSSDLPAICRECPLLASCTTARKPQRDITRHVWHDARDRVDALRLTPQGKAIYKRRKETVERSFADAKQLHGHRYARFRGRARAAYQCLLAATAQNMKKIALAVTRSHVLQPA